MNKPVLDSQIDPKVLADARRMVEAAARRLRFIELDPHDLLNRNRKRLSEAVANLHAALARLS